MDSRRRHLKWIIAGIIGLTVSGGSILKVEGSPLTSGNYSERIQDLETKEKEAKTELEAIAEKMAKTEQEAENLLTDLKQTAEELSELQGTIDQVSSQIDARESRLQSQVRAVQVTSGSANILSFIMESNSLGDAMGRIDVVNTLFSANQNLMQKQIEDKETIEEAKRSLYEKHEEQTLLAAQLENAKVELEENQAEQEMTMVRIAVERAEIGEEREALAAQQLESEQRFESIQSSRIESENTAVVEIADEVEAEEEAEVSLSSSNSSPSATASTGTVVNVAHSLTGTPYSFSGTTPAGFDCSGFTQFTYQRSGKSISRTAASQFSSSTRVSQAEAQPGDLIFFNQSGSIDHVGIYLGGGRFIGSQTSTGVAVASFTSGYWSNYVAGFGRP
ncbi:C40 family peptidase [Alkalibacterium olivapovliticus]|uniref:Cell wall-associated NlpC family hydrolase n=1 Tax=Alkalibacterium olivapovliticus TaxID=99907 RepID=A0A2T0W9W9_9LACT|nr:C40 family peptidase [Alkalibacterium olivapovliticus]PRY83493.1 cell wall-associated NlpC family hydrolase [Alkalibacterium olivapovliticus]